MIKKTSKSPLRPPPEHVPPTAPPFDIEFYVDDEGKEVVRDWLGGLSLRKRQVLGAAMLKHLQHLGIAVCKSELGRQLGQGLFEFRLRQGSDVATGEKGRRVPPEKILLRVFCHAHGDRIILLLGGYDKGEDPSPKRQDQEIKEAHRRLAKWKRRQATGRAP